MITRDPVAVGRWVFARQGCPVDPPPGFRAFGTASTNLDAGVIWYTLGDGAAWAHAAVDRPSLEFFHGARDALRSDGVSELLFDVPDGHESLLRLAARLGARPLAPDDPRRSRAGFTTYHIISKE